MTAKVVIAKKYKNIASILKNNKELEAKEESEESITEILNKTSRKEAISNNDRFDRIKNELSVSFK